MGRIFEARKHTMFARWDRMSKQFARAVREISIAVKQGGPNPEANPLLRRAIQNARAVSMPKDKIENAIRRASGKDAEDFEEVTYEGFAPHGVAILVETATNNPARTVASLRTTLNKGGGSLATTGSVSYLFRRMGEFRLRPGGFDPEELELAMIDHGLEEMGEGTTEQAEPEWILRCDFPNFGQLQRGLEERGITPISAHAVYIPSTLVNLPEDQVETVMRLIDRLEQEDDVQRVFHNLA